MRRYSKWIFLYFYLKIVPLLTSFSKYLLIVSQSDLKTFLDIAGNDLAEIEKYKVDRCIRYSTTDPYNTLLALPNKITLSNTQCYSCSIFQRGFELVFKLLAITQVQYFLVLIMLSNNISLKNRSTVYRRINRKIILIAVVFLLTQLFVNADATACSSSSTSATVDGEYAYCSNGEYLCDAYATIKKRGCDVSIICRFSVCFHRLLFSFFVLRCLFLYLNFI